MIGGRETLGKGHVETTKPCWARVAQMGPGIEQLRTCQLTTGRLDGLRHDVGRAVSSHIIDIRTSLRHRTKTCLQARLEFDYRRALAWKGRCVEVTAQAVGVAENWNNSAIDRRCVEHPAHIGHAHLPRLLDCKSRLGEAPEKEDRI